MTAPIPDSFRGIAGRVKADNNFLYEWERSVVGRGDYRPTLRAPPAPGAVLVSKEKEPFQAQEFRPVPSLTCMNKGNPVSVHHWSCFGAGVGR
jgi:hypothetical protein